MPLDCIIKEEDRRRQVKWQENMAKETQSQADYNIKTKQ